MKTCVLCFKRRNALVWMILSRSRWKSVRRGEGSSQESLPLEFLTLEAWGESDSSLASNLKRTL